MQTRGVQEGGGHVRGGGGGGDRHCLVVDETLHTGECLNRKGVRVVAAVIKAPK